MRELLCQLAPMLGNAPRCICFVVTSDVVNVIMHNWVGILGEKNLKNRKVFLLKPRTGESS